MVETNPSSFYLTRNWHSWILSKQLQLQRLKAPLADSKSILIISTEISNAFLNCFFFFSSYSSNHLHSQILTCHVTNCTSCMLDNRAGSKPSVALLSEPLSHKEGWLSVFLIWIQHTQTYMVHSPPQMLCCLQEVYFKGLFWTVLIVLFSFFFSNYTQLLCPCFLFLSGILLKWILSMWGHVYKIGPRFKAAKKAEKNKNETKQTK